MRIAQPDDDNHYFVGVLMNGIHSLLKRQLRRFADETTPLIDGRSEFLRAINDAYRQFDEDRRMLEHSLELTSQELLERNAQLSRINADLEQRVAERTVALSRNEARFRGLFEHAPVSIWEEDFSAVRRSLDELRRAGVTDLSAYFAAHPEALAESAARVKIVDVNRATLEMFQAERKADLLADLSKVLGPESLIPFKEELLALERGETSFENETFNYTMRGERRNVFLRLSVAPGYEQTWEKIFVGISDITARRRAEAALATERDLLQALMDNIPDTIYFKDTASRFTRINRAQAGLLGVSTPEEAIGKTDLDFQRTDLARSFY
jgi:PAS domain-containing protein